MTPLPALPPMTLPDEVTRRLSNSRIRDDFPIDDSITHLPAEIITSLDEIWTHVEDNEHVVLASQGALTQMSLRASALERRLNVENSFPVDEDDDYMDGKE